MYGMVQIRSLRWSSICGENVCRCTRCGSDCIGGEQWTDERCRNCVQGEGIAGEREKVILIWELSVWIKAPMETFYKRPKTRKLTSMGCKLSEKRFSESNNYRKVPFTKKKVMLVPTIHFYKLFPGHIPKNTFRKAYSLQNL